MGCSGSTFLGWYPLLYYTHDIGISKKDYIVADVHTAPTDENGVPVGWVFHGGTGPVNLGVFIVKNIDNQDCAYIGPFMSYYEYTTSGFKRFTDQEWENIYNSSPSSRPNFVNLYLADNNGNFRGEGASLFTSVKDNPNNNTSPSNIILSQNFPNPFNPSTTIKFNIPFSLANSRTTLEIFNTIGEKIRVLIDANLSDGDYLIKWEGKNDIGELAPSGIYYYHLSVGNNKAFGKMNLIK
jgi:hypothetical protein